MRSTLHTVVGVCVFISVVSCVQSSVARAAEDPESLIRQGIELRKAGQDARAEGYFRRAYQLAATPRTAAQLGLVELALGDYIHAEEHFTEALGSPDAWIREHFTVLKDSREVARRNLFHVELVGAPPNVTVTVEGASPRRSPPGGIVWVDPGLSATLRIEAPGYRPAVLRVSGAAGEGRRLPIEMQPLEPTPVVGSKAPPPSTVVDRSSTEPAPGRSLRIAGTVTAIVGAAVGVLGAVFYEQGTTKLHGYQTAIRSNGAIPWNPEDEDWESTRNKGVGLLIAGGVCVVGGVTLFLLGNHEAHHPDGGERVSLVATSSGAFFSYGKSF